MSWLWYTQMSLATSFVSDNIFTSSFSQLGISFCNSLIRSLAEGFPHISVSGAASSETSSVNDSGLYAVARSLLTSLTSTGKSFWMLLMSFGLVPRAALVRVRPRAPRTKSSRNSSSG